MQTLPGVLRTCRCTSAAWRTSLIMSACSRCSSRFSALVSRHRLSSLYDCHSPSGNLRGHNHSCRVTQGAGAGFSRRRQVVHFTPQVAVLVGPSSALEDACRPVQRRVQGKIVRMMVVRTTGVWLVEVFGLHLPRVLICVCGLLRCYRAGKKNNMRQSGIPPLQLHPKVYC